MRKVIATVLFAFALPSAATATEPEAQILEANWVMDAPVAGDHARAIIEKVTNQLDASDFVQGEWRRYKIGISNITVTLTLLHRYDGSETDFPTPDAGAEEWAMQLSNQAYAATIEWTTDADDRNVIRRIYTHDDRLTLLPRFTPDPRAAVAAALQHGRLDALHVDSALVGVLRGGHAVWEPQPSETSSDTTLPRLLIVASGYNTYRSKLGRDALMGPACVGWQTCGEQRGVKASAP